MSDAHGVLSNPARRAAWDHEHHHDLLVRRPAPPALAGNGGAAGTDDALARLARLACPAMAGVAVVAPPWADPAQGVYSISVAAELAGLHPQALRIWEREGLLEPARSVGGTRRYSQHDITRLLEITSLAGDGLNLAGIHRVLALQEETRRLHAEINRLKAARRPAVGPPG